MANKQSQAANSGGSNAGRSNRGGYGPVVAIVAIAAAATLLLVVLALRSPGASASAAADPTTAAAPTASTQAGGSGGLGALPPLGGNGGALQYMLNGRVTAISSTSITLGGNGPSVTAALTSATKVTGNVTSVSGIKVGDQVTAQISGQSSSTLEATAIQDPGQNL
jgi:hypothetical protein